MINHEIQFDGQEDFAGRKRGFAEMLAKFSAEVGAGDQVAARIIVAGDDDLLVSVAAGATDEECLAAIDAAADERQKALAAVRPPAPPVVEAPAEVQSPVLSDVEELEKAEAEAEALKAEEETVEESFEEPKKGKKK